MSRDTAIAFIVGIYVTIILDQVKQVWLRRAARQYDQHN
jgi:hypothetical protein